MAQPAQRNLGRMSEIAQVAVRHGFGYWLETHKLTDLLPWPRTPAALEAEASPTQRGRHLREMLDELGPTFVKFGQLLSTRPDIVPPDIIAELRGLQDDVTPFPFSEVERVIREELELPIEKLFTSFEEKPLAAASIGQVHRAVLPNGKRVAVKVQRPDAPRQIEADLSLLYQAAKIAKDRVRSLDFIDATELVDEFARSIRHELDYRQEARNAQAFHRNFAGHPHVRIPHVYWSYSRQRVLTLELLNGQQLADVELRGVHARRAPRPRVPGHRGVDDDDLQARVLPRRPAPGEHPRARRRPDRPRRLRAGGEAVRRRHVEADRAVHRCGRGERRRACAAARRSRRALRAIPRGRADRGDPRALLQVLRRAALRGRPAAGDQGGVRTDLLAEPAAADAVRAARQGDRDDRRGRGRALPGLQRLRGGEAVRPRPDAGAVHAAADGDPRAQGGARRSPASCAKRRTSGTT